MLLLLWWVAPDVVQVRRALGQWRPLFASPLRLPSCPTPVLLADGTHGTRSGRRNPYSQGTAACRSFASWVLVLTVGRSILCSLNRLSVACNPGSLRDRRRGIRLGFTLISKACDPAVADRNPDNRTLIPFAAAAVVAVVAWLVAAAYQTEREWVLLCPYWRLERDLSNLYVRAVVACLE